MIMNYRHSALVLCWILLTLIVSGCATITPSVKDPQIDLLDLKPLPAEGLQQRFSLTLKVSNPNDETLHVKGMSYSLRVEGYNLVSGVSNQIPAIPAYETVVFDLEAGTHLINGLRFIEQMLRSPKDSLSYSLEAVIDLDKMMVPDITVSHEGQIKLRQ